MNGLFPRREEKTRRRSWYHTDYASVPWYRILGTAGPQEHGWMKSLGAVLTCAIDFHILQVPLKETRTHVWNRNRDGGLKEIYFDVPRPHSGHPSKLRGGPKFDRTWIVHELTWAVRISDKGERNRKRKIKYRYIVSMSIASVYTFTSTVITTYILLSLSEKRWLYTHTEKHVR